MRIGIISVAPPFRGGIAAHTAQFIQVLSNSHKVKCYNFSRQYPDFLFPGKTQYLEPKEFIDESLECLDSINPISWFKVANQIKKENFDLVIFRFWNPFFAPMLVTIARLIKRKNPKLKLISLFDNFLPHESQFYDKYFTRSFVYEMHGNIVQSKKVEEEITEFCSDISLKRLFHPLYTKYGDLEIQSECKAKLKLKKKFIILYFGLVRKYKGLDILMESIAKLKTLRNDFSVIAAGESYGDSVGLQNLISKLNINDVFEWQNNFIPDDHISTYFSACDILVLPYRSASQSGIVQIAYHFNKPVIVTNVGGLPEMVEIGRSGSIVNPESPEELSKEINKYLDKVKLAEMSNFIEIFKEKYSWKIFVEETINYVNSL
ncbi:MAG: hypothetical protein CMF96_09010 [Candidatus Marinimicrobia bacterium]|nr:hypothetical protein [Candidatus Neomarinimicrobiota bacterium]